MAGVRAAGSAGEQEAGIIKNTDRIPSLSGTVAYRIPDELGSSVLGEVKNVSSLSYTNQLRDFVAYAQQQLQFNLYVRGSTALSGPLQAAADSGEINLFRILSG
jgi:Restriction endonuclease fold toxin 7